MIFWANTGKPQARPLADAQQPHPVNATASSVSTSESTILHYQVNSGNHIPQWTKQFQVHYTVTRAAAYGNRDGKVVACLLE